MAAKFIKRVGELQAMPGVASHLLQTLDDPSASVNVIAEEVRRDQALMAMVLRMANSAFYKSSGQVRDISARTLLIHGAQDVIPARLAQEVAALVQHAQTRVIDGAGHMPFFERPEEFFGAVSGFLGERDAGS